MEIGHPDSHALKGRPNLFDSVQIPFLLTDAHSKILYANRQARSLFGYEKEDIEGERIRLLFLEDDWIYFLPNILYLTLYKEGFDGEVLLKRKNGIKIFVRLITTCFREEGDTFLTFSLYEIQQLKQLERQRLEAERWESLGRMVEEIAHQVRNPIVSIGGYTKRLQKIFPSSPKGQSYLDQILHETRRLNTMIQRVEEYVRVPRPIFRRENLLELVEVALQPFLKGAEEEGVSFVIETGDLKEGTRPFVDRNLAVMALSHVVKNSIEAVTLSSVGKRRMSITISLFEKEDMTGIAISDKGPGIPKRDLKFVFEPFFSTRPDHVGLGLTLVRRVLGEHGGSVRLESRLRQGVMVILYFPKDRRRRIRRELIFPEIETAGYT